MSGAKVDVLAVLDRSEQEQLDWGAAGRFHWWCGKGAARCRGCDDAFAGEIRQARAALAELIEADREYDEAHAVYAMAEDESGWPRVEAAIQRRAAALSRIGAGQ